MANSGEKMHIDKSVSIGHIVSIVLLCMALVGGWLGLNDRVTENTVRLDEMAARQDRTEYRLARALENVEQSLLRIEERLDKKADR
jgi:hypothetical protein